MISRLKQFVSRRHDPYWNIALEKYLTTHCEAGACTLFLWQNQPTVVIGRNQNAQEECRLQTLMEDGGLLARRFSGGGAVYHDLGNVNFSFLIQKEDYDIGRQSEVILLGLKKLGVPAERTGRNDFAAEGRKFSGNAFYESQGCCCHHGTIMLDVDTEAMERYLSVSPAKLHSKGVPSVRARVMNLKEIIPDISVPALNAGLTAAFQAIYGLNAEPLALNSRDEEEIQREAERLASPAWLFPPRIPFAMEISGRFSWGGVRIGLCVRQNRVQAAECQSDAMDERIIREIQNALPGCPFEVEALEKRVLAAAASCEETAGGVFPHTRMAQDIAELIQAQLTAEKS